MRDGGELKSAIVFVIASVAVATSGSAWSKGVSPYLPLQMSPDIERQIERVLLLAGRPVMRRPIPAAVVLEALPQACPQDPVACRRVRTYLRRYMNKWGISDAGLEIALTDGDSLAPSPNLRGEGVESEWRANVSAYYQPWDHLIVNAGGVAYEGEALPTGSFVSMGFDFAQLDIGFREHWLSPMTDSAMLITSHAPTIPSITLSNYRPLTRWGFGYELFVGELSRSDEIRFGDELTSGEPRLAGLHLSMAPVAGWSLAANRLVQYGGGARGGRGLKDFIEAILDPSGEDNQGDDLSQEEEFGNQQASLTSEFIFPGSTPFAVYFEYAGEDTSYDSNYRLGNAALSMGLRFPRLWKFVDVVYEASEWQNSWYVHGIYLDGPTNEGHVLGHWGGDYRAPRDGVGAQAHMIGLGWTPPFGGSFQATYRTIANENYSSVDYERAHIVELSYSRPIADFIVGAEIMGGRDTFGDKFTRLAAFGRFGDSWDAAGSGGMPESLARPRGAELFVDAGVNASHLEVRRGDISGSLATDLGNKAGAHVGIGARRSVSQRSDLGVRLELDQLHDELLLAIRAIDYRYRLNDRLAVGAFFGAARYDLATPAFGYYGGVGGQWRNMLPSLDLNLDLRFADRVARDKLLPADPSSAVRPDIFYDMYGATLSLSYRW